MNKEWSELNKKMQNQLKNGVTFKDGIDTLFILRDSLMEELLNMKNELRREDFNEMPFPKAKGYHCKTIDYSIWHIFRIEDIVLNSLIQNKSEVFEYYKDKMKASIVTTGNELVGEEIVNFSREVDLESLFSYVISVKDSIEEYLKTISFNDLKIKFTEEDKERLKNLNVVSRDEKAFWLIDYWGDKNIRGLIQMPFSRHWIMHIEASIRIKNKIIL